MSDESDNEDTVAETSEQQHDWLTDVSKLKEVADFLREGMKYREGQELGKRVSFFKGKSFVQFCKDNDEKAKGNPKITSKLDCVKLGNLLIQHNYIHRSDRHPNKLKKVLAPSQDNTFAISDSYYTWMYEGSKTVSHLMTVLLIVGFLACTAFPIWPRSFKVGLWYCSVTLLGIFFVISVIRLIIFCLFWMCGYEFWIFPRLFDESLSFVQSFIPAYRFDKSEEESPMFRMCVIGCFVAFSAYIYQQPTDFDDFLVASRSFTEDLYSGNLLPDRAESEQANIDKAKMPTLEELMADDKDNVFAEEKDEDAVVDQYLEDKFFSDDEPEKSEEQQAAEDAEDAAELAAGMD